MMSNDRHSISYHDRTSLRVASYNIHAGVGIDQRLDASRTCQNLSSLNADVIGVQELGRPHKPDTGVIEMLERWGEEHGFDFRMSITSKDVGWRQGLAIFSRFKLLNIHEVELSVHRREPRRALCASIVVNQKKINITATHLGLRRRERLWQAETLCQQLNFTEPNLLLGDLNILSAKSEAMKLLKKHFPFCTRARTYPSPLPLFSLDRIMSNIYPVEDQPLLNTFKVLCSDHRPALGRLDIRENGAS